MVIIDFILLFVLIIAVACEPPWFYWRDTPWRQPENELVKVQMMLAMGATIREYRGLIKGITS